MNWKLKAIIQKVLQYTPGGSAVHYYFQKIGGGFRHMEDECVRKIDDWRIMMEHLKSASILLNGTTVMEIGTGWYPTFPLCLYLTGVNKVYSFDLTPLLRAELTERCLKVIGQNLPLLAEFIDDPSVNLVSRYQDLLSQFRRSKDLNIATNGAIEFRAPADARNTSFGDNSIDFVFSNSVLEHIPTDDIRAILEESHRVLRLDGHCFHSINCGDHYAYIDGNINQLNYLRFSENDWKLWTNKFLYQNRLRAIDFVRMLSEADFSLILDTSEAKEYRIRQLSEIEVADFFSKYSDEELCITTVDLIGKKA